MKTISRLRPAALLALGLALMCPVVGWPAAGTVLPSIESGAVLVRDEVSLSEAVARVKRQYGGRILEAETRESNGRRVHVVKVLTREGRVRTVRIPAGGDR